jgi:hypothetical protein
MAIPVFKSKCISSSDPKHHGITSADTLLNTLNFLLKIHQNRMPPNNALHTERDSCAPERRPWALLHSMSGTDEANCRVYDKAEYHYDGSYPDYLPKEQAFHP